MPAEPPLPPSDRSGSDPAIRPDDLWADDAKPTGGTEPLPGNLAALWAEVLAESERGGTAPHRTTDTPTATATAPTQPASAAPTTPPTRTAPTGPRRLSPFWRVGFPVLVVVAALLLPVLAWVGVQAVLTNTGDTLVADVTDPSLPGWEALTEPTPTLLMVQTDANGGPVAMTVLSRPGEGTGGVLFVPVLTVVEPTPGAPPVAVFNAWREEGPEAATQLVETALAVDVAEEQLVGPEQLADLVRPVAPLALDNPDDVVVTAPDGTTSVAFPAGPIELSADQVPVYLATTSPGESDLNRLGRHAVFWDAWLGAVAASPDVDAAVPGEVDSGLAPFVRDLARAEREEITTLPVVSAGVPGSDAIVCRPVPEEVQAVVASLVPFPVGYPPGSRARVRVLDGTGRLDHGLPAAPALVEGGGQVDQIGNAAAFGQATTEVIYYDEGRRAQAEALVLALGVGGIVVSNESNDAVDVTVVLGDDYARSVGR